MPSAATASRTDALASGLRDAVGRLSRRMRRNATIGLSLGQMAALRTLDRHGAMTPTELALHEKVQPPSVTKIIVRLEAEGLITRTPDPTDRRQVMVAVSPAGQALLTEDRRRRDAWVAQRIRGLAPDEVAALRAALPVLEKLSRS